MEIVLQMSCRHLTTQQRAGVVASAMLSGTWGILFNREKRAWKPAHHFKCNQIIARLLSAIKSVFPTLALLMTILSVNIIQVKRTFSMWALSFDKRLQVLFTKTCWKLTFWNCNHPFMGHFATLFPNYRNYRSPCWNRCERHSGSTHCCIVT